MRRRFVLLVAVAMALSIASSATPALAQAERVAAARHVEGQIRSVDPSGRTVTLSDGTRLTIPADVRVDRQALTPGATVRAAYEEKAGEKVVTSLELQQEPRQ
jgi:uncharacterized protein DUF1344